LECGGSLVLSFEGPLLYGLNHYDKLAVISRKSSFSTVMHRNAQEIARRPLAKPE
jgi:hypothetical protein